MILGPYCLYAQPRKGLEYQSWPKLGAPTSVDAADRCKPALHCSLRLRSNGIAFREKGPNAAVLRDGAGETLSGMIPRSNLRGSQYFTEASLGVNILAAQRECVGGSIHSAHGIDAHGLEYIAPARPYCGKYSRRRKLGKVLNGDLYRQQTTGRATRRQKLLAAKFAGRNRIVAKATAARVVYTARKMEPPWPNAPSHD